MGCTESSLSINMDDPFTCFSCDDRTLVCQYYGGTDEDQSKKKIHPFNLDKIHCTKTPYLGSFFFPAGEIEGIEREISLEELSYKECDALTSSSVSSSESEDDSVKNIKKVVVSKFPSNERTQQAHKEVLTVNPTSNTLPSFRAPLHLRLIESYYTHRHTVSENDDGSHSCESSTEDDFSYDPLFSSGTYKVETSTGEKYGGGLRVKLGAQFASLRDQYGRVLAATRSRNTSVPSHILYSAKPFYDGQKPSPHRSVGPPSEGSDEVVLYPWALLQKTGPALEDKVHLYYVDRKLSSVAATGCNNDINAVGYYGSYFCNKPAFHSTHTYDGGMHKETVISRIETSDQRTNNYEKNYPSYSSSELSDGFIQTPCCHVRRDRFIFDIFDVIIAPGIDPLLIICCLAIHTRMDMELLLEKSVRSVRSMLSR